MPIYNDELLVEEVKQFLRDHYKKNRHHVACALVSGGETYFALHLDTSGYDICAEPIAISNALAAGEKSFSTIVAVYWDGNESHDLEIVPPCGDCRQMLAEYAPGIEGIVSTKEGFKRVPISTLLPYPYHDPKRHIQ